jgi:G3E family GTPase
MTIMTDRQPVDLIVLCGFLGSGKTTLLVDFLRQDQLHDTAVIINEAGETGIDGVIVAEGESDLEMTLLANGCVCCSLRSSLVFTVTELLEAERPEGAPPIRRIVLETSGLSRPGPILASLADPEFTRRGLRVSVVTTFDAELGGLRHEQFDEAAAQIAAAQRIVITKIDKVSAQNLEIQVAQAQLLNPLAEILADSERAVLVRKAFTTRAADEPNLADIAARALAATSLSRAHARMHVMRGVATNGMSWEALSCWLDDLAGCCGERLLRVKALVHVTDCDDPILIQGVGTTYSMPRRMTRLRSSPDVLVVITRDITCEEIMTHLTGATVNLYALTPASVHPKDSQQSRFSFTSKGSHVLN